MSARQYPSVICDADNHTKMNITAKSHWVPPRLCAHYQRTSLVARLNYPKHITGKFSLAWYTSSQLSTSTMASWRSSTLWLHRWRLQYSLPCNDFTPRSSVLSRFRIQSHSSNSTILSSPVSPTIPPTSINNNNNNNSMYRPIVYWMFSIAGLVVGMIHIGGLTRLTQSGLSMTSWSPLGSYPPVTKEEWDQEFHRYQQFPEWTQRQSMTLQEFQYIYAWEYAHRMLGRLVGVAFIIPWMYFTFRQRIPTGYQPRMMALFTMGGTQGLVGWWMVQSGLGDDRRNDQNEIRVKPLRLAAHLSMAIATYGALLWTGLDIYQLQRNTSDALRDHFARLGTAAYSSTKRLRFLSVVLTGLTFLTITSGALVAGNDAGRAYNTWPKMNNQWIPMTEITVLQPLSRNVTENTATVQFNHRWLASLTAITALSTAALGLQRKNVALLTPQVRVGLYAIGLTAPAQFLLGVTTLLHYVPVPLAALHQLGSVVLFTSAIYLTHSLRHVAMLSRARVARSMVL
jgi:heme a synthase